MSGAAVIADAGPATSPAGRLTGRAILDAVKAAGIRRILSVPDITTSEGLLYPIARDPDFTLTRVCKEDEAVGISAGLWHAGERSLLLIQHTGFLYALNAIRAVAVEYRLPVCMMVGLLNKEPGVEPDASSVYGVRIMRPILQAMGIAHDVLETDADAPRIAPALERAFATPAPTALLIGRSPEAS